MSENKDPNVEMNEALEILADASGVNDEEPHEPKRYKINHHELVETEVDAGGMGHTYLGGIDISGVTKGIKIESIVGDVNKITITMIAMPTKVRALGVVEIIETHPERAELEDA